MVLQYEQYASLTKYKVIITFFYNLHGYKHNGIRSLSLLHIFLFTHNLNVVLNKVSSITSSIINILQERKDAGVPQCWKEDGRQ